MQADQLPPSQGFALMMDQQALRELRSDSTAFVQALAQNIPLLKDLLDISFRPRYFESTRMIKLSPDVPQLATETLSGLYEDFINLLAHDKILPKDQELQGAENEQNKNQQSNQQNSEEFLLLKYLHNVFEDPEFEDASMSNLSRILGPLYYQCPQKIIKFYETSPYYRNLFMRCLWRREIMQFFCKLMEIENGSQFFKDFKQHFINQFYKIVKESMKSMEYNQWLESVHQLHKFISQKIDEKYDGSKYSILLDILAKNDELLIQVVNQNYSHFSSETLLICLRWLEQSLKKDSAVVTEVALKSTSQTFNRRKSMSSAFYADQKTKNVEHRVSRKYIVSTSKFLILFQKKNLELSNPSALMLISFYRTLYFWIKNATLCEQAFIANNLEVYIKDLANQTFFERTFKIINIYARSSSLHNIIKELIIECLQKKILEGQYFLSEECSYKKALMSRLGNKKSNLLFPFGSQIYHIYAEVSKMDVELCAEIIQLLGAQKERRQKLIGGVDPRKLSDNFRNSTNNISSSSEQEYEQIEIKIFSRDNVQSGQNAGSGGRSFRFGNATSLEMDDDIIELQEGPNKGQLDSD